MSSNLPNLCRLGTASVLPSAPQPHFQAEEVRGLEGVLHLQSLGVQFTVWVLGGKPGVQRAIQSSARSCARRRVGLASTPQSAL